ncbi:nitrate reductase [Sneathiella sp.]|jgi:nitrate reductase NapE|uniref:nitrate reductase n=1 Tax=Sneathiella sp. TaxID=1964365 RepID=UPI0039E24A90
MQLTEVQENDRPKRFEFLLFLFLTFILIPALTIGIVGAYGFAIWIFQILYTGPPAG